MPEDDYEEMFVIVDENDNVIGTATREECHSNNKIIHRGVHIFIVNSKNELLVPKRSEKKDTEPEKFDASVGAHVAPNETYKQTAVREIKEELGIDIDEKNLINIGKVSQVFENEKEIVMNFAVLKDIPIGKIEIDEDEVSWIKYFKIDEVKQMLKEDKNEFARFFFRFI